MTIDILLNGDNDLDLTTYNLRLAKTEDYIVQKLGVKLRTILGEWFLDTSVGVPYFQDIFKKQIDPATVESVIKAAILESPGIVSLLSFDMSLSADRQLTVSFSVESDVGELQITETL